MLFFGYTVEMGSEWFSNEAVNVLSGDDGAEVDWVFKEDVSVEVGGMVESGHLFFILKLGGRLQSKVSSEQFPRCPVPHGFW